MDPTEIEKERQVIIDIRPITKEKYGDRLVL